MIIFFLDSGVIMSRKIIGVFGAGNVTEAEEEYQLARKVGHLLARHGFVVLTGWPVK
jgi:predicted Rossmann-fold nucleotide-binding protein